MTDGDDYSGKHLINTGLSRLQTHNLQVCHTMILTQS